VENTSAGNQQSIDLLRRKQKFTAATVKSAYLVSVQLVHLLLQTLGFR
jgi:hypothetical protein